METLAPESRLQGMKIKRFLFFKSKCGVKFEGALSGSFMLNYLINDSLANALLLSV